MSLLDFGKVIFGDIQDFISWMQFKHFLTASKDCTTCNVTMNLSGRSDVSDGYRLVTDHTFNEINQSGIRTNPAWASIFELTD